MNQGKAAVRKRLKAELVEAEKELQDLEQQLETNKPEFGLGTGSTGFDLWEVTMVRRDTVVARIDALRDALARLDQLPAGSEVAIPAHGSVVMRYHNAVRPASQVIDLAAFGKAAFDFRNSASPSSQNERSLWHCDVDSLL